MSWKDKVKYISELNLFMLRGGYNESERRYITKKIVNVYDNIMKKHSDGQVMYREDNLEIKKKKSPLWYKEKGYDYNISIPAKKTK